MPKEVLADTTLVGDWPDKNCDRCTKKGTQVIHWGPLAVEKKDQTATMFCRECWQHKSTEYRNKQHGGNMPQEKAQENGISDLKQLLRKNAWTITGLTHEEQTRARQLIDNPILTGHDCWICKMSCPGDVRKAIFDIELCKDHALRALNDRK